jgi:predicted RNase H-like nuclease (RuvC/YqgF family)
MEIAKLNKDIMEKKDRCDELVNQFNEKDQNIRMMEERFN